MRPYLEMFERLTPDSVLVSTTPGRQRAGHFGELTANAARAHGCVGTILDGNLRDIEGLRAIGFPVFYRDLSPLNGIGRWEMTASQQPVAIGGVTVNPGDIVFAEFDGILVVPRADAVDRARAGRGDRRRRGPRARRGAGRRLALVELPASWLHLGRAVDGDDRGAARSSARRSAIREVFDAANRIPTRSGSRSASRASARRGSSSTPRSRRRAAGLTGYTPNGGYASLREALAEKIERVDGFAVDPDCGRRHAGRDERALLDLPRAARAGRRGAAADAGLPEHGRDGAAARRRAGLLPARARRRAISRRASELEPLVTPQDEGDLRQHARQPDRGRLPGRHRARPRGARGRARRLADLRRGLRRAHPRRAARTCPPPRSCPRRRSSRSTASRRSTR